MATELATGYVSLTVETRNIAKEVQRGFDPVQPIADRTGKAAGKKFSGGMGAGFKAIGGLFAGAMAGLAVKDFLGDSLAEARESQKVGALTANVIKTTGGAAKITAAQVGTLAAAISNKTGKDDELVQTGANLLLTFKNVRNEAGKNNDIFNQATAAAVDLSASGFGSVEGASKMLGKALNDPIKGISALGRAGVTFTQQQKDQIKAMVESGDTLGAQKIIMAELQSQVGGAASATATAGEKARVVFDNLKESAGNKLLPIVDGLANKFTGLVAQFQAGEGVGGRIRTIFEKIGDVVGEVVGGVKAFTAAWIYNDGEVTSSGFAGTMEKIGYAARQTFDYFTGTVWPFLQKYQNVLIPIAGGILAIVGAIKIWSIVTKAYTAVQLALNVVMTANPIGLLILAIVGLVAALVIAYKRSETFRNIVNAVWASVKAAILGVVNWFRNTAWPWLRDALTAIKDAFVKAKDKIVGTWEAIRSGMALGWNWIRDNVFTKFKAGLDLLKQKFEDVKKGIKLVWDGLQAIAKAPIKFIIDTVLNKGLIGGFNWLSGKIGGPSISPISIPGFARGGVLPGYTPGRDVHRFTSPTGGTLDLSGGEAIMRPEFTKLHGGKAGIARLNAMARQGVAAFKDGGVFGHQGFAGGGVLDWIKGKAGGALDWMMDKAGSIFKALSNPSKFIQDRLSALGPINGGKAMVDYGKAAVNKGVGLVVGKVKDLFSKFTSAFSAAESEGGTAGGSGMGYRAQMAWARQHTPWAAITSTVRTGNPQSDHDRGRAIDLAGARMSDTFEAIKAFYNPAAVRSLYYSPKGSRQIRFGKVQNTPPHIFNTHKDHVHWAMSQGGVYDAGVFDSGGSLRPGPNLVHNNTGAWEDLTPTGRAENITVQVMLQDLKQLRDLEDFLDMLERSRTDGRKAASGRVSA